jgi:hypothetical protein
MLYSLLSPHRAHLAKDSIAKREFYRTVLMKGFHWYVQE